MTKMLLHSALFMVFMALLIIPVASIGLIKIDPQNVLGENDVRIYTNEETKKVPVQKNQILPPGVKPKYDYRTKTQVKQSTTSSEDFKGVESR